MQALVDHEVSTEQDLSQANRRAMAEAGVLGIGLVGGPGCGKTGLIEATVQQMPTRRFAVVVSADATTRDIDRLARAAQQVVRVEGEAGPTISAGQLHRALETIDLAEVDALFIENVGTLDARDGADLGQDVTIGVFSVGGGDDKAAKHPQVVHGSAVLLLNKIDLLPYVPFDVPGFRADVRRTRPDLDLIELTVLRRRGMDPWLQWIDRQIAAKRPSDDEPILASEWYFG